MVIYYNPHVDDFLAEPLQFRILRRRALKKYGFLLDEARLTNKPIRVLVDGTASGLIPERLFHLFPRWFRSCWSKLEYRLWKRINGFGEEVRRVDIPEKSVDEVLLAFSYKAATGRFRLREQTLRCYQAVVFHLSHYFLSTAEKSANIRRLPNAFLAGDSDPTDNDYFNTYFSWYSNKFLVLPFAVGRRFQNQQDWFSRDPKAVATGSFHDLRLEQPAYKYVDFTSATGSTTYHPVRLAIHESAELLADSINCRVSPYRDYGQSKISRFFAHFLVTQKKYFSINIVDLYNQHKYAVVGEELSGFPALGAFEAMACGCVLIAQPHYYVGLGVEPGVHYLPYDGSIEQLSSLLQSEENTDHSGIAARAASEVSSRFAPAEVYARWQSSLTEVP